LARIPRSIDEARANLEASISVIPERYRTAVERAEFVKYAASDAAEKNWADKVSMAIQAKSRQAGVRRAGDAAWKAGALNKGVARIGEGLRQGLDKWHQNFSKPYAAVVSVVQGLPPKGIDPIANIDARAKPVVRAFVQNKVRGRS
jgi:hypothetical protein